MSKKRILIILGLVVAILPILGIPRVFGETLSALAGLAIVVVAFLLHRKSPEEALAERKDTFTQNGTPAAFSGIAETNHSEPSAS